jgi:hypothetical protein
LLCNLHALDDFPSHDFYDPSFGQRGIREALVDRPMFRSYTAMHRQMKAPMAVRAYGGELRLALDRRTEHNLSRFGAALFIAYASRLLQ